eukprot:250502-Chlamydomonas_euryale.AAC.15
MQKWQGKWHELCCSGFREGAAAGAALGRTSAAVKTLEIFAGQVSGTAQMQPRVAALLAQIQSIPPRNAMLSIFQQLLLRDPDAAELHNFTRVGAVASEAYLQPSMTGGGGRHRTQHARDQHDEKGLEEKETKDLGEQQDMPSALELAQAVALQSVTRREEAAKELDTIELHDMDALIRSVYQELKQLGCDISGSLDTPAVVLPVRGAAEHAMKITTTHSTDGPCAVGCTRLAMPQTASHYGVDQLAVDSLPGSDDSCEGIEALTMRTAAPPGLTPRAAHGTPRWEWG